MRLAECQTIKTSITQIVGKLARVYLFSSREEDGKRPEVVNLAQIVHGVFFDEVAKHSYQWFEVNLKVFCFFRPFIETSSKTPDTKGITCSNGKSGFIGRFSSPQNVFFKSCPPLVHF